MDGIISIPFVFPHLPQIGCIFTTKLRETVLGVCPEANISFEVGDKPENVLRNRKALIESYGFQSWKELRQVHGTDIHFDPAPGNYHQVETDTGDGLATTKKRFALVVKTADCQPIMAVHKSGEYVCALHCGWRGNKSRFPGKGISDFCEHYGLDPADVLVVRGPSLGPGASGFKDFSLIWPEELNRYYDAGKQVIDLWAMTRDDLLAAGVRPENLFSIDLCTFGVHELFFSYRQRNTTGRQAGIIWIK